MAETLKVITTTIWRCIECPHAPEASRMSSCCHPQAPKHSPFFDWVPIPDWCPLPDADQVPEETTP